MATATSRLPEVVVREARMSDIDAVYRVASSAGNAIKDPFSGFLVYDYTKDPDGHKRRLAGKRMECAHFYVAEIGGVVCGFLIGYSKSQWLKKFPEWPRQVVWRPGFELAPDQDFFLVDMIAVHTGMRGRGIGRSLHNRMLRDLARQRVTRIFSESIVGPVPNVSSIVFRLKLGFELAGIRYESEDGQVYTNVVYHKSVPAGCGNETRSA